METRTVETRHRSLPDRIARQVLLVHGREPQALISLRHSLLISAVRCVLTYAVIPVLVLAVGWLEVVTRPLALMLSVLAFVLAIHSLRRVWLADWPHRWVYTAFMVAVIVGLGAIIIWDARALFT